LKGSGKMKKRFDLKILISAIVISSLLFLSGLGIGYTINLEKLSTVESKMLEISQSLQKFQLEFLFLDVLGENATCPLLANRLSEINKESYLIGTRLESYGSGNDIMDYNEYINTKKKYSRLLIGYWLLAKKLKSSCKLNANTIVYFFSKDCSRCDDQSFILTYLKNKLGDRVLIFALDADLDEPSVQTLKTYYNITKYPSLIINENLYEGFQPKERIEALLFTD